MSLCGRFKHFSLGAGTVLFLAAPATVRAENLPAPIEDLVTVVATPRPSTTVPAPPGPLPAALAMRLTARDSSLPGILPIFEQMPRQFLPAFGTEEAAAPRREGFSVRLMSMMNQEARRFRRDNVSDSPGARGPGLGDDLDSIAEAGRNAEASRVITRSFHRALDQEMERAARVSLGLGPTLDFLRNLSFRSPRAEQSGGAGGPEARSSRVPAVDRPQGLRGDVGLRLDAHPALMLRARFRSLRGRIDLPVRDEPARLTVESSIGARGRAVLSASQPRDGQGWATLTFNFWF